MSSDLYVKYKNTFTDDSSLSGCCVYFHKRSKSYNTSTIGYKKVLMWLKEED